MTETTYRCAICNKTHKMRFAGDYKPFRRWLMECRKCRKYTLQRLVGMLNPSQANNGPVSR